MHLIPSLGKSIVSSIRAATSARITGKLAEILLLSRRIWSAEKQPMPFKQLLDDWSKQQASPSTIDEYSIRLPLDAAARIHALEELWKTKELCRSFHIPVLPA